jgi:hypothetical protein
MRAMIKGRPSTMTPGTALHEEALEAAADSLYATGLHRLLGCYGSVGIKMTHYPIIDMVRVIEDWEARNAPQLSDRLVG